MVRDGLAAEEPTLLLVRPDTAETVLQQVGPSLSAADALARLSAHAFAEQRLLGDVAREVVARRLRFTKGT